MNSSIYLHERIWKEHIKGWVITDCAVRSRTFFYLCLRMELPDEQASRMFDHDIETKFFVINLEKPGTEFGARTLTGYNKPRIGVATKPLPQGLLVARNTDGQVSVVGGGSKFPDEFIHPNGHPMPWKIKCIDGYAYSVGGGRSIYKRVDIGKWVQINAGFPTVEVTTSQGFNDMDAFSESDMYAVGGHGDVWHYDGSKWKQMGFPTNVQLGTVTCAGDGNVYVSGEGGSLWVGQKSTWRRVYEGGSSVLWNDAVWFQDKLWLSSDYQFQTWNGQSMERVMHEGESVSISGHMDARDGLLVVASLWAVKAFDGRQWRTIVAPYLD